MIEPSIQLLPKSTRGGCPYAKTKDAPYFNQFTDRIVETYTEAHRYDMPASSTRGPVGTELVAKSDQMMRQTHEAMERFVQDAPNLGMAELATRQMELTMRVATAHFQFSACASVAQSGKTGVQTLMRNQ